MGLIQPTSDASEWGCGAYCDGEYISVERSDDIKHITDIESGKRRNMPLCEAIGVAIAVSTWRHRFAGRRVRFHSDCTAVVTGCNKGRASIKASQWLHSVYTFINELCCTLHIDLRAVHIKGTNNIFSDLLSLNQIPQFHAVLAAHSLRALPAQLISSRAQHRHTQQHGRVMPLSVSSATSIH